MRGEAPQISSTLATPRAVSRMACTRIGRSRPALASSWASNRSTYAMSSAPCTFGTITTSSLVADRGDQGGQVVEHPRAVEGVDARPQLRRSAPAPEIGGVLRDRHQALARGHLVVGLDGVLEVAEQHVDGADQLRHLGRHLLVRRVEEVDGPARSGRDLAERLGGADRERAEEVLGAAVRAWAERTAAVGRGRYDALLTAFTSRRRRADVFTHSRPRRAVRRPTMTFAPTRPPAPRSAVHAIRPSYDAITRAVRWTVLVLAVVLAMTMVLIAVVTAPARADPGRHRTRQVQTRSRRSRPLDSGDRQRHGDRHLRRPVRQRALGRRLRHARRGRLRLPVRRRARLQRGLPRRRLRRRLARLPAGPVHLVGRLPPGDAQRAVVLQLVRRPALGQRLRVGQGRQGHRPQARQVPRPSARSAGTSAATSPTSRTSTAAAPS